MNRKHALAVLLLVFAVAMLAGCEYFQKGSAAIVDGAGYYCENNTALGRDVIRGELRPELEAEGVEICLGCAGDAETMCVGAHRPKIDDSE